MADFRIIGIEILQMILVDADNCQILIPGGVIIRMGQLVVVVQRMVNQNVYYMYIIIMPYRPAVVRHIFIFAGYAYTVESDEAGIIRYMAAESAGIIIKFMCICGVPHFLKFRGKRRGEKRKCFDFSVNKYKIHIISAVIII